MLKNPPKNLDKLDRKRLCFILFMLCLLPGLKAIAADHTWQAGTGVWNLAGNWVPAGPPAGAADRGIFTGVGTTPVTFTGNANVGRVQFDVGALAYTFIITTNFTLNGNGAGAGITNLSAAQQIFNITADRLQFENAATIAGDVAITNGNLLRFQDNSGAGPATITNNDRIRFQNQSNAGTSTITNNDDLRFQGTSNAGTSTITNNDDLRFQGTSNTGTATIMNNGAGILRFQGTSNAGTSTITNNNNLRFQNNSNAGNATITNNAGGILQFQGTSNAGTSTITNNAGATLNFNANSDADASQITNSGTINFNNTATAGTSTITNNAGATVDFDGNTTADSATILNAGILNLAGIGIGISIGSLSGAGNVILGNNNNLTLGNLGFNDVIGGNITGNAISQLFKIGGGILTLTGANTYGGGTTINGGTLNNTGSLNNSTVTVNALGTYAGTGSSGPLVNNGTVAPGSPTQTGTLTVNGNYTGAGTFLVKVGNTGNDLLQATGTTTLTGGNLSVNSPTLFGKPRTFTIMTATGGVIGQFLTAQMPSNFRLSYLPNAVQLIAESASISFFVLGGNAAIVARYLDAIIASGNISPDLQTVFDALGAAANQGGGALRDALNQISPDPYREIGYLVFDQTSMINQSVNAHQQRLLNSTIINLQLSQSSSLVDSNQFMHHVNNRNQRRSLQSLRPKKFTPARQHNQMPGVDTALALSETNLPVRKVVQTGNTSVWMEPYGQLAKKRNSAPLVGTKSDTYGMTMGGDTLVAPKTYVGILGGLINTQFDWTQKRGHGSVKGFYGGAYGLWLSETGIYVDGQVTLGREYIKTKRNIRFQTINRQARETHGGFSVSPDIETGYLLTIDKAIIQPFLNWAYTAAYEDSFTEKGANSLNIRSPSKTSQFSRSELGTILSYFFFCNDVLFYPSVQLSWVQRRHIGSQGKGVKFNLTGQTLGTTVFGDNRVRDLFSPGVAFTAQFQNGFYVTTDVKGEVGSGQRSGQLMFEAGHTF